MTADNLPETRVWATGAVVEIFERAGAARALVLLDSGAVIDVALAREHDVHLGDRMSVEAIVAIDGVAAVSTAGPTAGVARPITR